MKRIGIIGGGQLGKMMILDGKRLDHQFFILDPTEHCPAHSIADAHIVAAFDDIEAIEHLASLVDVVTYEFEHISVEALRRLEKAGHKVYPSSGTLAHIQNKLDQKIWLMEHGIPVPSFAAVESYEHLCSLTEQTGYPVILKTCTGGYDGKGNAVIDHKGAEEKAYEALGSGTLPLMLEEWIPFEKEVSILACRSTNGEIKVFPAAENRHRNSILDETTVPALLTRKSRELAWEIARDCVRAVDAYGMLCIEMFVTKTGDVLVNELAPRPHNSGHYTIEGCYTSQYENHIRAILGMPLGNTDLIRPTAMKNLIGEKNGLSQPTGVEHACRYPNVKVHIYGKEQVSIGRKMGHITATGETVEEALEDVRKAHRCISF